MITYNFEAIGTRWSIDVEDNLSSQKEKSLLEKIMTRIELFDKTYSRFRSDSLIMKMSQTSGTYTLPDDGKKLLSLYKKLYEITDGLVTPLIGSVLSDAGYDETYSLKPRTLHHPDSWENVLEYISPKLTVKKPALLDFGAAGKGYLIDIIGRLLEEEHITNFCIDGSGDMLYSNKKNEALRVGLEHPENTTQAIGVATITKGSLCGSAGNRRKWADFHHIINPQTLTSPKDILAVWVTAATAIEADALTTCLFFTSAEKLKHDFIFEYAIVRSDYSLDKSHDFPGEFFYNK